MLTSFPTAPPKDNLGGMLSFSFIPTNWVTAIPDAYLFAVNGPLTLAAGKTWLTGYTTTELCDYKETGEEEANGPKYKFTFEGFLPKISYELSALLDEMELYRFILDTKDNNGIRKLVGDILNGLTFKQAESPQKKVAGLNGYAYTFYGEFSHKAYALL